MMNNRNNNRDPKNAIKRFDKISIGLASPESILAESRGEVLKPETINYRTHKPERDGLFCERIFGPVKDFECACGKYKRIRYKGIVCDRCGVEVTEKKVRRDRVGHINLVVPIAHIWYFRSLPNKIGYILGLPSKKLDMIIYYERYVVIQAGIAVNSEGESLQRLDFLTEEEYLNILDTLPMENQYLDEKDPNKFIAKMGAECIMDLLARTDLNALSYELRHAANNETSKQRKTEALKRLQVVESFRDSNKNRENRPEWMIMKVVPVIPPELRPLVPLDGGRFATSDLNDLYRRVIIRNNRLKRLMEIKAPEVILRNEKRMLQESVDSLFDNTRKASAVKTESNRPLKSLSDSLKGKQGRFRQNLLGKRVDYSARSVIVVGPEMKLYECGIPKDMAAELYKPFVIRKLIERGIVKTVKSAKKIIDKKEPVVWDILENVIKGHPVLLNRAPTLHRLGIQAFQPKLIEGKAIQLHPLVCTAFNADFDGDQMAVHLPLGPEAILEAQLLMLASHNILNPANGAPITVPSQDMVLGLYYMTKERLSVPEHQILGEGLTFYSAEECNIALNEGRVELNARVKIRAKDFNENGDLVYKIIQTTAGRVLFNEVVPQAAGYINEVLTKKSLRDIIGKILAVTDVPTTASFLDSMKDMGYKFAFKGGLSFSLGDIRIPEQKDKLISDAREQVEGISVNYNMGLITNNERYNQVIDIWTSANAQLTELAMKNIREDQQGFNSVYMMLDSGARGSKEQIRQLTGMRGLMAKPKKSTAGGGEIIENPILSNFKEGLSILEYFISTHGARKGLADTALRTADSGYLTRRLHDVAQELIVREDDCGTTLGVWVDNVQKDTANTRAYLETKLFGRALLNEVELSDGRVLPKNTILGDDDVDALRDDAKVNRVRVRSVLTCDAEVGVCKFCYGRSLATGQSIELGEAVGVIAAQSIGEPGTQLTMRTFHTGGVAGKDIAGGLPRVVELFEARNPRGSARLARATGVVRILEDEGKGIPIHVIDDQGVEHEIMLPTGSRPIVKDGQDITAGDRVTEGPLDPKELMEIKGPRETQVYLVEEVQKVYRDQGVSIHDKHIELIVRQMTRRVGVQEPGDTVFLPGERADAKVFRDTNRSMVEQGKRPAEGRPELMGITKASLATESWLSAASFQETTRVLTEAAIDGKGDNLVGLKENIIIGKLIPAGSGMDRYNMFDVSAPDYVPMAYYSSDDEEDPAAFLAGLHGTYISEDPQGSAEQAQ